MSTARWEEASSRHSMRRAWSIKPSPAVEVQLTQDDAEYCCQVYIHGKHVESTYRGTFLGSPEEVTLEAAQAAALGRAHDHLSELLLGVESTMGG